MVKKANRNGTPAQGGDKVFSSLADLTPDPQNARRHNPRNVGMLVDSLHQVGAARSIVVDENGVVLAGNATIEAAAEAGIHKVKTVEADGSEIVAVIRRGLSKEQKTKLALYDNRVAELAEWNPDILSELVDTKALEGMFSDKELAEILTQTGIEPGIEEGAARLTLSERFLVPPFSVLDARQGYWQDRKRAWIALGIQSELGRGGGFDVGRLAAGDGAGVELLSQAKLSPGGSPRPAMKLRNGHTVRGDGRGREI